jgi:hypothetical protein
MGTDMVNYAYMQNIHSRMLEDRQAADHIIQTNKMNTSGIGMPTPSLYGIPPTPYITPPMYSDQNYYQQSSAYRPDMNYQLQWTGPTTSKNYAPFYPQHMGYSYTPPGILLFC